MEHWEAILEFAENVNAENTQHLRTYSYPPGGRILPSRDELDEVLAFIRELQERILNAPPLVPAVSETFPEDFTNDEHVRMLQAAAAVFEEATRLDQPFEGDVDT